MIVIRPALAADRAALERMAREVVAAGEMFAYDTVEGVLGYWLDARGVVFLAELDGALAGSYVLKPCQPGRGSHVANAGYMTLEAFRGRGVGRALGVHSIREARERGYLALQFNFVVSTNESALRLWTSLGFRAVGTSPAAFRRPNGDLVDAFVLHRRLDGTE
jgi:GNAT superfamily N-acetyltransferase